MNSASYEPHPSVTERRSTRALGPSLPNLSPALHRTSVSPRLRVKWSPELTFPKMAADRVTLVNVRSVAGRHASESRDVDRVRPGSSPGRPVGRLSHCLLYTSDAADE